MIDTIFNKIDFNSNNIALIEGKRKITYHQLKLFAIQAKDYLKQVGAKRVATVVDNSIEWVVIDMACQMAKIVFIPLPHFFSLKQIEHALAETAADTLFVQDICSQRRNQPSKLKGFTSSKTKCLFKNINCLQSISDTFVELPNKASKITFTSGSTGNPKGVCLSLENQLTVAQSLIDTIAIQQPRHLCLLPLSTLLENIAGIYAPLMCGGSVILLNGEDRGLSGSSKLDAKQLLTTISVSQPETLILVPELLNVLVGAAEQGWPVPKSLTFIAVGGGKVSVDLLSRAEKAKLPVYQGYGLSECASVVCLCSPRDNKLGSVGKPLSHIKLSFEKTEIVISGNVFLGYLGDKNSWYKKQFKSGDLGSVDSKGNYTVNGRIKNLIITSFGRNISPEWIETECLQKSDSSQPMLQQCVIFGDASPFCVALVYPFNPAIKSEIIDQFILQINRSLPDYAQIKNWLILRKPLSYQNGLLTENNRPKRLAIAHFFSAEIEQLHQSYHQQISCQDKTENNIHKTISTKPPVSEGVPAMTFFQRLNSETQEARQYLHQAPIINQCMSGNIDKNDYVAFLKEAYHHVKHTVPLLMSVGSKLPESKEWLREAVAEYIEEELGHQEWILNDIAACGFDKEAVRHSQPGWATELMVSYAYDSVNRVNPLYFFGMVHVLEGTSIALADMAADSIFKALNVQDNPDNGISNKAFSYLRSHGSLDIEHVKFFESLMNQITDKDEQQAIIFAANKFYHLYGDIFYSLKTSHGIANAA